MSHLKHNFFGKKLTAIVTLACFFISSVAGQALAVAVDSMRQGDYRSAAENNMLIPPSAGRITDAGFFGGNKVVVVIQDLHCHAEVQRNISNILKALDTRYGLNKVYQEGAFGSVDTSWLSNISSKEIRSATVEGLMKSGELTGAEYYSVASGKPRLIEGLENETVYHANARRLQTIFSHSSAIDTLLAEMKTRLSGLQETYLSAENKRLQRLVSRHSAGSIDTRKYYGLLLKYGRSAEIAVGNYKNINGYLAVNTAEKHINYPLVSRQLQSFLSYIRSVLPYAEYKTLLDRTHNFSDTDVLNAALARIIKEHSIAMSPRFSALAGFIKYTEQSREINPLNLIREDRKLLRDIMWSKANSGSEKDIVFLSEFFGRFSDYYTNRITADDYLAYKVNYVRFARLWPLYADEKDLAAFDPYAGIMRDYYAANIDRNNWFLQNTVGDGSAAFSPENTVDAGNSISDVISALDNHSELLVTVAGGFHTAGYTELLRGKGVSYLVVTPSVTQDAAGAEALNRERIKLQESIPAQAFAAILLSQQPGNVKSVTKMRAAVDELRNTFNWDDAKIQEGINREILGRKATVIAADKVTFILDKNNFKILKDNKQIGDTYEIAPASIEPERKKSYGRQFVAFGINSVKLCQQLVLAGGIEMLLACYLTEPSVKLAQELIGKGILVKRDDALVQQVKDAVLTSLKDSGNFPGIDASPDNITLYSTVHEKLIAPGQCVLASMGILTDSEEGVSQISLVFHGQLLAFLEECVKNNSPPQGFASVNDYIRALAEHETGEYSAVNIPSSPAGRAFTQYLAREYLKKEVRDGEESQVEDDVSVYRDPGHYHRFIEYACTQASSDAHPSINANQYLLLQSAYTIVRSKDTFPPIELVSGRSTLDGVLQPVIAVFDVHGILMRSTWKQELALAYQRVTGKTMEASLLWVETNTVSVSDDKIVNMLPEETQSEIKKKEFLEQIQWAREYIRETGVPELLPGARELLKGLRDRGIPIVITSGSERSMVIEQLRKNGLLEFLAEELIIGKDAASSLLPDGVAGKPAYREAAIDSIRLHFPGYRIVFFNDGVDGIDRVRKTGGISFCIPWGSDKERKYNRRQLVAGGADILFYSMAAAWSAILEMMPVPEKTVMPEASPELFSRENIELPFVMPVRRTGGIGLLVKLGDDLRIIFYSCKDDSAVHKDGSFHVGELEQEPLAAAENSFDLSPNPIQGQTRLSSVLKKLWEKGSRYVSYRGVIVSFDRRYDGEVAPLALDTLYLHKCIDDSVLLKKGSIRSAAEIGTNCGYLSAMLLSRLKGNLKTLFITGPSIASQRLARRSILQYLNAAGGKTRVRAFVGGTTDALGTEAFDLLVVAPPHIPTLPSSHSQSVIKDIFAGAARNLNSKNAEASCVLTVTALQQHYFDRCAKEYKHSLRVEKLYNDFILMPVPDTLNIQDIERLSAQGIITRRHDNASGKDEYVQKVQAYRIMRLPESKKSSKDEERAVIESVIYTDSDKLVQMFQPLMETENNIQDKKRLKWLFPEIFGYLFPQPEEMNYDLKPALPVDGRDQSLLRHIIVRGIGRKLRGLETSDISLFQSKDVPGVSEKEFGRLVKITSELKRRDILPWIRCAFLYHDVAKSGQSNLRNQWKNIPGIDFRLPGEATSLILRHKPGVNGMPDGLFENIDLFNNNPHHKVLNELFYRIFEVRGYPGQWVRGEVTYDVFEEFTGWIRENLPGLREALNCESDQEAAQMVAEIMYLFSFLDVSSLHEGLMTSELNAQYESFYQDFKNVITPSNGRFTTNWNDIQNERWNGLQDDVSKKAYLKERLGRFRRERRESGESVEELDRVIEALSSDAADLFVKDMLHFQGWYVESATYGLRPETQVKIIALSLALARDKGIDLTQHFHINFFPLMKNISTGRHDFDPYKTRIIETVMSNISLEDILLNPSIAVSFDLEHQSGQSKPVLGAAGLEVIDGKKALMFDFNYTEEARNLINLLHVYEKSNSLEFHDILEKLAKLYGISKDAYDRMSNEIVYLQQMAGAKHDKARLFKYGKGEVWVEVGPGDGRTLMEIARELRIKKRIKRLIGIEVSDEAYKALTETLKRQNIDAEAIKGDASHLKAILTENHIPAPDTIIFSSVLHEIFSYGEKDGKKFNPDIVRDVLRESLKSLAPGGRILIRDGVIPPDGETEQDLVLKGQNNKDVFDYYINNFKGRDISYHMLKEDSENGIWRIRMKRKDVMEFLYTLTWCYTPEFNPASLPYEVREQYGVMTRKEYVALLQELAGELGFKVREVPLPAEEQSYLQEGYVRTLSPYAQLYDLNGNPVSFPASNMMIVVEKEKSEEETVVALGVRSNEVIRRLLGSQDFFKYMLGRFIAKPSVNLAKVLMKKKNPPLREYVADDAVSRMLRNAYLSAALKKETENVSITWPRDLRLYIVKDEHTMGKDRCILGRLAYEKSKNQMILVLPESMVQCIEQALSGKKPIKEFASLEEMLATFMEHEMDENVAVYDTHSEIGKYFSVYLEIRHGISAESAKRLSQRTSQRFHDWLMSKNCPASLKDQQVLLNFADTWVTTVNKREIEPLLGMLKSLPRKVSYVFADMDGTLVQAGDTEISRYMIKKIRNCLEHHIVFSIVSASSFEDVQRKILERFIWELAGRDIDQKIFVQRNKDSQSRRIYEDQLAMIIKGFSDRQHCLFEKMPVAANNGGQIWEWDRINGKYYCSYADKIDKVVIDKVIGNGDVQGILQDLIYKSPYSEQILADYKKIWNKDVIDEKSMIKKVGLFAEINQITFYVLGEKVSADQKKKYSHQETDPREQYKQYLNEQFEAKGLPLKAIVSGQSRILIVSTNTRKSSSIPKLIRRLTRNGMWGGLGSSLYFGDNFIWSKEVAEGPPLSDGRDSSIIADGAVDIAVNVGSLYLPEVESDVKVVTIGKGPVGTAACLEALLDVHIQSMSVDERRSATKQAADTALTATKPVGLIIPASVAMGVSPEQQWLVEHYPLMIGKTCFHYFENGVAPDVLSSIVSMNAHGMYNVVFIPEIPTGSEEFVPIGKKICVSRNGKATPLPVFYGNVQDTKGDPVAAVCIKGMRLEDLFAVAHDIAAQPQLNEMFENALGIPAGSLYPDIVDLHSSAIPESLKNDEEFVGKDIALRVSVLSQGDGEEDIPARNIITDIYAPFLLTSESNVMAPGADQALVMAVSMTASVNEDSGIGELPGCVALAARPENKRVPVLQLLPFCTPDEAGNSFFRYRFPCAIDAALLCLDKVPGTAGDKELYGVNVNADTVNRREVTGRKIRVMRRAVNNLNSNTLKDLEKFQREHTGWLIGYGNAMCREYNVPREERRVFDFFQMQLSLQAMAATADLHKIDKKVLSWIEFDDPINVDENLKSLGLWLDYGFDGVTIGIRRPALLTEGILDKIKVTVDEHSRGRNITLAIIPPEGINRFQIEKIKEQYRFKVVRTYDEIMSGETLDKNDVVMMDSLETGMRPHVQHGNAENWKDDYLAMAKRVRNAGMYCFALGDLFRDPEKFTPFYRMPREGSSRINSDTLNLADGLVRQCVGLVTQEKDPDTLYWHEYETAFAAISSIPRDALYAFNKGVHYWPLENRMITKRVCSIMFAALHQYADDRTSCLSVWPEQAITNVIHKLDFPHPVWDRVDQRTQEYKKNYAKAGTDDEKRRLNAGYAGFVRGVIAALSMPAAKVKDADDNEWTRRLLQSLYMLAFHLNMDHDEVLRRMRNAELGKDAAAFPRFMRNRSSQLLVTDDTQSLSVVYALARIRDLSKGVNSVDALKTTEDIHQEIRGLIQSFSDYLEHYGVFPESIQQAAAMMDNGKASNNDTNEALRVVVIEMIHIYERLLRDDRHVFSGAIKRLENEMPQVYKAVLQAA